MKPAVFFRERKIYIVSAAVALIAALFFSFYSPVPDLQVSVMNGEWFFAQEGDDQLFRTWETDGVIHFLLPGYMKVSKLSFINGDINQKGNKSVRIQFEKTVHLALLGEDGAVYENDVCIHRGSAVYTMYVKLPEGLEAAAINKEESIWASVRTTKADGSEELHDVPVQIKGRGNSTWQADKKPYVLFFDDKVSLTGLNKNDKFILLSSQYDGTKILNKLIHDLNRRVGLNYAIGTEFVDLYINGDYRGFYTVCEPVDHGVSKLGSRLQKLNESYVSDIHVDDKEKGIKAFESDGDPEDISGVYMIEKDIKFYYSEEPVGFAFGDYAFSVKYPNNLTVNEAAFLRGRFRTIDELLENKDPEVFKYIDVDSFARRYLTEEFVFNSDAGVTSWYFYYRSKDPLLFAGPGWDYDGAFGESNDGFQDYTKNNFEVEDLHGIHETLKWDERLFDMPEYKEYLIERYRQLRPVFVDFYTGEADRYLNLVEASVNMDTIRWSESEARGDSGHYREYGSTKKYLKFFMYQRIALLDERILGHREELAEPETEDTVHTLTFRYDDGKTISMQIRDGEEISLDSLPPFDKDRYAHWRYEYSGRKVNEFLPVYEDMDLSLEPWEE